MWQGGGMTNDTWQFRIYGPKWALLIVLTILFALVLVGAWTVIGWAI
jgi:hypothetical protein